MSCPDPRTSPRAAGGERGAVAGARGRLYSLRRQGEKLNESATAVRAKADHRVIRPGERKAGREAAVDRSAAA